jgi:hypothetical protein
MSMPREMRVPHVLIIDEAAEFADELLMWALGAMRKTGLYIVLAGQDLSSFRKKEGFDMRSKVLTQCNLICFNQSWPEDTDVLSRVIFSGKLSFKPLVQEVERDGGYLWHEVTETGQSFQVGVGASAAHGRSQTETDTHGTSTSVTDGTTQTTSDGTTQGQTRTDYASDSRGQTHLPGGLGPRQETRAAGTGNAASSGQTHSTSSGQTHSVANATTSTHGTSRGTTDTDTESKNAGMGQTCSQKKVPLHQVRVTEQKTGALEQAVADQLEEGRCKIASQKKRQAFVKVQGSAEAPQAQTREVPDPFASAQAQMKVVEWMKRELYDLHDYYTVPLHGPEEEEKRVGAYLGEDGADEPVVVEGNNDDNDPMFD